MKSFEEFLKSKIDISDQELRYVTSLLKPKEYKPNSILLRQGEVEKHLSFIEKGIFRYYYIDSNGKESNLLFVFDNWFVGEMDSFISQSPSFCFIETLTEAKIWRISYDDLQETYKKVKTGERFGRLMMEELYVRKTQRERSFLTQTAEQRYLDLLKSSPHILQQVPLKYIASYIGVTPQALSRIRKRIN